MLQDKTHAGSVAVTTGGNLHDLLLFGDNDSHVSWRAVRKQTSTISLGSSGKVKTGLIMARTESSLMVEIPGRRASRSNSLQCLQFVCTESNIDKLLVSDESLPSPCHSDSSGISSLSGSSCWESSSVPESISQPHVPDCQYNTDHKLPPVIRYQGRDLLDLAAHLRGSLGTVAPTVLPARDVNFFLNNRSVYDRLAKFQRSYKNPEVFCDVCYLKHGLMNHCCFFH